MKKMLFLLLSSLILLFTGCSSADSWPETLYLDRLFVGGSEVSAAPASAFQVVFKTEDETVNNSVTLQDDNELNSITLEASTSYEILAQIVYASSPTADIKFQLQFLDDAFTSGNRVTGTIIYTNASLVVSHAYYAYGSNTYFLNPPLACGGNEVSNPLTVLYRLTVTTPAVDKTLKLTWAQSALEASNTYVKAGSFIEWRKIE